MTGPRTNLRGVVLNVAGTLRAEALRASLPTATPTEPSLLDALAAELEDVARAMLELGILDLDGPLADGPAEVEAKEADFDAADTLEIDTREILGD